MEILDFVVDQNEAQGRIVFGTDSPFFDGHFPKDPILPGVAQLDTVVDLASQLVGHRIKPSRIKRMKFAQVARPLVELTFVLRVKDDSQTVRWTLSQGQSTISEGEFEWMIDEEH